MVGDFLMFDFDALLDEAISQEPQELNTVTVPVSVGGTTVTLKFTEMDPRAWYACTMPFPPRVDIPVERMFGYNLTDAALHAAVKCGVRVDGDEEVKLTPAQWGKLFKVLDREGISPIVDAIFGLNETGPLARLEAAKKAAMAASKKKQPSQES
jgi:hypothetical protein